MIYVSVVVLLVSMVHVCSVKVGELCNSVDKTCDANMYCQKENACSNGQCYCNTGYMANINGACFPAKLVGDSCSASDNCTYGSSCSGGKCTCPSEQEGSSDKTYCIGASKLDGSCSSLGDCKGNYYTVFPVQCNANKCQCQSGYKHYDDNRCIWKSEGDSCTADSDCSVGAACVSSKCQCKTVNNVQFVWKVAYFGYGFRVGACVHPSSKQVGYGQSCNMTDASLTEPSLTLCSDGLICKSCPGDSSTICLNGATSLQVTMIMLVITTLVAKCFSN